MTIPAEEVRDVLRQVGNGELVPLAVGPTWHEMYAGDVKFKVGEWLITIFNDCDSFDYIDSAVAPDGRRGEFDDWWPEGQMSHAPEQLLYAEDKECCERMEKAFESAKPLPRNLTK